MGLMELIGTEENIFNNQELPSLLFESECEIYSEISPD